MGHADMGLELLVLCKSFEAASLPGADVGFPFDNFLRVVGIWELFRNLVVVDDQMPNQLVFSVKGLIASWLWTCICFGRSMTNPVYCKMRFSSKCSVASRFMTNKWSLEKIEQERLATGRHNFSHCRFFPQKFKKEDSPRQCVSARAPPTGMALYMTCRILDIRTCICCPVVQSLMFVFCSLLLPA